MESGFWAASAVVLYSYLGYPALLALGARRRPAPPVRKAPFTPRVSLVMVACDEAEHVEAKLRNCLELDYPPDRLELLVVSDGSRDATGAIVARFADRGVRLLALDGPRGKPAALNAAVPQASGEVVVLCDARQRFARDAVRELAANFADPRVGAVSGELHLAPAHGSGAGEGLGAYWSYEKAVRRLESRFSSVVGATGAIYAIRRELFRPLDERLILDDLAIPLDVAQQGYRVVFEPAARAYDRASDEPAREFRRKLRTLAGNYQLVRLRPDLLRPDRNPLFFELVSHKLSRLSVPWCLLLMLANSAVLAWRGSAFFTAVFGLQAGFYGLAALGLVLSALGVRPRLLGLPLGFTLLNAAAALAPFRVVDRPAWKAREPSRRDGDPPLTPGRDVRRAATRAPS
jgi:cellulose synthase/poly-beta-1,6-N-acetylglucosamine synthase-like glycosyltransferase